MTKYLNMDRLEFYTTEELDAAVYAIGVELKERDADWQEYIKAFPSPFDVPCA